MSDTFWSHVHEKRYSGQDWTRKPSIFAEEVVRYFPMGASILELGCGQGQDGLWFAQNGFKVVATDFVPTVLEQARLRKDELGVQSIEFKSLDVAQPFEFADGSFDVVYAHLSLHYFNEQVTQKVFAEIYRVLKPGGVLAFLVNSVTDPEYDTGIKIEENFYETEGTKKRYFSAKTAREFAKDFKIIISDEKGETYKDQAKGVHNLVRFVGTKI